MLQSQTCPKCTVYVVLHPSPQRKYRQQLRGRNLTGGKWLGCNKDNRGLKEGRKNPSFAAVWRKTLHAGFHAVQRSLCLCWRRKRLKKRLIILSEASCFISIPWAASSLRYTYGNCMLFLEICVVFFFFSFLIWEKCECLLKWRDWWCVPLSGPVEAYAFESFHFQPACLHLPLQSLGYSRFPHCAAVITKSFSVVWKLLKSCQFKGTLKV